MDVVICSFWWVEIVEVLEVLEYCCLYIWVEVDVIWDLVDCFGGVDFGYIDFDY